MMGRHAYGNVLPSPWSRSLMSFRSLFVGTAILLTAGLILHISSKKQRGTRLRTCQVRQDLEHGLGLLSGDYDEDLHLANLFEEE